MQLTRTRIRLFLISALTFAVVLGILILAAATHGNRSFEAAVESVGGGVHWEFRGPKWIKAVVPRVILDGFADAARTRLYRDPSYPPLNDADWQRLLPIFESSTIVHRICFDYTHVTDATVETLQDLRQLEVLSLPGTRITDKSLETICTLRSLKVLDLGGTRVSDAGLQRISSLRHLEYLNLDHTAISEASLEHLKALPNLKHLSVVNTGLPESALISLQADNPNLTISDD